MFAKVILLLALAQPAFSQLEEYTLGEYDTVKSVADRCNMRSMWQVRGAGRKFVNPYESPPGTILRLARDCVRCLSTPTASPPAEWGVYKTLFDGSETLAELADQFMGSADLASEFVTDVTSGAKPTDLKCEQLFYPISKVVTNEDHVFQAYEIDAATTLGEMAMRVFDDSSSWEDFYLDEEGNVIPDASADKVLQAGEQIYVKLFGGDVVISEKKKKMLLKPEPSESETLFESLQAAAGSDLRRWPARRTIPYGISSGVTSGERSNARGGIQDIQRATCLRFSTAPAALAVGKIRFQKRPSPGCSANVGLSRRGNYINAGGSCSRPTMVHEIGHSIGLHHEQQRSDRDRHVTIRWSQIPSSTSPNYAIKRTRDSLTPYDYRSIMHYSARGRMSARPSSSTNTNLMGSRGLSRYDIVAFNWLLGYSSGCGARSRSSHRGEGEMSCKRYHRRLQGMKGICGGNSCKVMATPTKLFPTCEKYCASAGLTCDGAWQDDNDNSCTPKSTVTCETDMYSTLNTTSDMICECMPKPKETCQNSNARCREWAQAGQCEGKYAEFMQRRCCRSCERVSGRPLIGAMDTVCDVSSYPDLKKDCGCFALVDNIQSKYGGTCKNYCESFNRTCLAARDDLDDDCDHTLNDMECDEVLPYDNEDALCQCSEPEQHLPYVEDPQTVPEPPSSSAAVVVPALSLMFVQLVMW